MSEGHTECNAITVDMGWHGSLALVIKWTDHNCIPHQEEIAIKVIDDNPRRLVIERESATIFEALGRENKS